MRTMVRTLALSLALSLSAGSVSVTLRARDAVVYRGKRIVVDWAERARQSNDPVINEACKDWLALQAELDGRQEQRGKPDWDKLEQLKREYDAKFRGASK